MKPLKDLKFVQQIIKTEVEKGKDFLEIRKNYLDAGGDMETWKETIQEISRKKDRQTSKHSNSRKKSSLPLFLLFLLAGFSLLYISLNTKATTIEEVAEEYYTAMANRDAKGRLKHLDTKSREDLREIIRIVQKGTKEEIRNLPKLEKARILIIRHTTTYLERANLDEEGLIQNEFDVLEMLEEFAGKTLASGFKFGELKQVVIDQETATGIYTVDGKKGIKMNFTKENGVWKVQNGINDPRLSMMEGPNTTHLTEEEAIFLLLESLTKTRVDKNTIWLTIE